MPEENGNGSKPNFFLLYQKVGNIEQAMADLKEAYKENCNQCERRLKNCRDECLPQIKASFNLATDAMKEAREIKNKALGISLGVSFITGLIGFLTDWFGLKK